MDSKKEFFVKEIVSWFIKNQRKLPFRNIRDPYKIWISEIMLQQTRMNAVLNKFEDKYSKFISKFPNIESLANAQLEDIMFYWSGLGYYNRAKNLHQTAKIIQEKFNGIFPKDYNELIQLPGIGEYTASAILSIAYNLPYSVFDGNVHRLLSRFFYNDFKTYKISELKKLNQELIQNTKLQPSIYNQSLMEYGALMCAPKPKCKICRINSYCDVFLLPEEKKINIPPKRKKEKIPLILFVYVVIQNDKILIQKSSEKILKNHYFFPFLEKKEKEVFISEQFKDFLGKVNHTIMNYQIQAYVFLEKNLKNDFLNKNISKNEVQWIEIKELNKYLFTSFAKKILNLYLSKKEDLFIN